MGVLWKTDPSM